MMLAIAGTSDGNPWSWIILIVVVLACLGLFKDGGDDDDD